MVNKRQQQIIAFQNAQIEALLNWHPTFAAAVPYGIPTDALQKMCLNTELVGIDSLRLVLTCNALDSQ